MRFDAAEIRPVPWKNGGGTTHELAVGQDVGGQIWRLSLAEIAREGPFSSFAGQWRIHTIISGQGLRLMGTEETLEALPLAPLEFDGGIAFDAQFIEGPCRAVNLIYDPRHLAATAEVRSGPFRAQCGDLVFVINGALALGGKNFVAGQGAAVEAPAHAEVEGTVLHFEIRVPPKET